MDLSGRYRMVMPPVTRRTSTDWVDAAYDAFAEQGLDAVRVEALARTMGTSKGSFYWHFPDHQALVAAVLERWATETEQIIAEADAAPGTGRERFARLTEAVSRRTSPRRGEMLLYTQTDRPGVADALHRVTEQRLAATARMLEEVGHAPDDARARATLALATVLGLQQLSGAVEDLVDDTGPAGRALLRTSLEMIVGTPTGP